MHTGWTLLRLYSSRGHPTFQTIPKIGTYQTSLMFRLAVAGAHMTGLPLNKQLTDVGATFVGPVKTAAVYRMYDLGPKPSLIRQTEGSEGFEMELELWDVPMEGVGPFIQCGSTAYLQSATAATCGHGSDHGRR